MSHLVHNNHSMIRKINQSFYNQRTIYFDSSEEDKIKNKGMNHFAMYLDHDIRRTELLLG